MQTYHEEKGRTEIYNCIIRRWEKSVNENRVLRVNESQNRRKKGNRGACNCPPPPVLCIAVKAAVFYQQVIKLIQNYDFYDSLC